MFLIQSKAFTMDISHLKAVSFSLFLFLSDLIYKVTKLAKLLRPLKLSVETEIN